jgi:hypothetical protein
LQEKSDLQKETVTLISLCSRGRATSADIGRKLCNATFNNFSVLLWRLFIIAADIVCVNKNKCVGTFLLFLMNYQFDLVWVK